jgi:hypothetical protein
MSEINSFVIDTLSVSPKILFEFLAENNILPDDETGFVLNSTSFELAVLLVIIASDYSYDELMNIFRSSLVFISIEWDKPYDEPIYDELIQKIVSQKTRDEKRSTHEKIISIPGNNKSNPGDRAKYVWKQFIDYYKFITSWTNGSYNKEDKYSRMAKMMDISYMNSIYFDISYYNHDEASPFLLLLSIYKNWYKDYKLL